ncbi:MAG: CPBP family intramembrane glutamic endopeptidase [Candidatus Eisenbacteria bacterium]
MEDPTQAPPTPPVPELPVTEVVAEAATGPTNASRHIARGLFVWLLLIAFGGLASALLGHAEGALFFAMSGVLVLAQATDAAVVIQGYRDWVQFNVPRGEARGLLFRLVVRAIVPICAALFYCGIGAWALQQDTVLPRHRLAAGWSFGAAVLCALLMWRPAADLATRACFRSGPIGRTRRLTARVVVMALLLPVPLRLLAPEMLAALQSTGEPLADAGGLAAQLAGEVAIALAGVGLFVRRNWRDSLERLGIAPMQPAHYAVAVLGLAAIVGLNAGMEWMQRTWFHALWLQDSEITKLIAADLPIATSILLGVSAGLGEEISLRGALQPRLGIVLTSLVFAALHVQYSWIGMLTIALLGALLGLIRARTNTTTAIVVHAAYDIFAVLTSQ